MSGRRFPLLSTVLAGSGAEVRAPRLPATSTPAATAAAAMVSSPATLARRRRRASSREAMPTVASSLKAAGSESMRRRAVSPSGMPDRIGVERVRTCNQVLDRIHGHAPIFCVIDSEWAGRCFLNAARARCSRTLAADSLHCSTPAISAMVSPSQYANCRMSRSFSRNVGHGIVYCRVLVAAVESGCGWRSEASPGALAGGPWPGRRFPPGSGQWSAARRFQTLSAAASARPHGRHRRRAPGRAPRH